jgi:hypothetical protein|tara:strand:- start:692 stop:820 length:129 start_codon:yes stop_codon:yes gene_type:complete
MLKNILIFCAGGIFFTVGFSGIARIIDKGVDVIKIQSQELSR